MREAAEELDPREIEGLLEDVFRLFHYDFRAYARPSIRRRVSHALMALGLDSVRELRQHVEEEPEVFPRLLAILTVQVSAFFRDPSYWRALRERVFPRLATYPFLRVWVAGCGNGEEAYSMAILLHEMGLLERSRIYATDIHPAGLELARRGVYSARRAKELSAAYFAAGGKESPSDYYTAGYGMASMASFLRSRILFSDHSLATDADFAEMQLTSCRNVLIYFEKSLQERALGVLARSLCPRGFLGLGSHESLQFSSWARNFETFARQERIYRMRAMA